VNGLEHNTVRVTYHGLFDATQGYEIDALYTPTFRLSLFSVNQLDSTGSTATFGGGKCSISSPQSPITIIGHRVNDLYFISPGRTISLVGTQLPDSAHIHHTKKRLCPLLRSTRSHSLPCIGTAALTVDLQTRRTRPAHEDYQTLPHRPKVKPHRPRAQHRAICQPSPTMQHRRNQSIPWRAKQEGAPSNHAGLLIHILSLLDANDPRDANLYCAFCIAHAGFLWAGEITCTANDLAHGYMELAPVFATVPSVRDWSGRGRTARIRPSENRTETAPSI
jgi:hypothetical protein